MSKLQIKFDIQSFWHIGCAEEGGAYVDSLMLKDRNGLPYLPGRAVKGLLRSAFSLAESKGWFQAPEELSNLTDYIFGSEGEGLATQGLLTIDSASLGQNEMEFFVSNNGAAEQLFDVHFSTAINENGVAQEGSLRSMEVAVPMVLVCDIDIQENSLKPLIGVETIKSWLKSVCPLVSEFGAKRTRGYGQVVVTAE
ncbi:RAMP superfamily CRISPR-associated protein [Thalassotalea ponticola]|uniref:RAMP superfamily CRISPR-associated protein n=1 Tax=Thalassotalea ponticola TaxID=1523392 RepID=UPI0025B53896|nr:RAMP superfamily CRISPR-associated protein [Thalassotalea ponticola]MDN3651361.1 RAMP superfamily CRISPR-associated protein [Thalassotalea ponticola]